MKRSPELRMHRPDDATRRARSDVAQHRPIGAERRVQVLRNQKRRQHVQRCRLRTAIADRDLHQDVFRRGLRVLDEHVEIAILVEHARVEQLVFELVAARAAVRATRSS